MKKIIYILHGNYKYLSRAKKQIKTLEDNGFSVSVFNLIFSQLPDYSGIRQNIEIFKTKESNFKIINFIYLLYYNFLIGKSVFKKKTDFIICRELSVLPAGVIAKVFNPHFKLIYDSNELSVEEFNGISKIIWRIIEKICISFCNVIIHANKERLEYFVKKYNINLNNIPNISIENFPYFNNKPVNRIKSNKFLYFGSISPGRNIEEVISAFSEMPEFLLHIIGFGNKEYIDELKARMRDEKINNINILPPVNDSDIYSIFKDYNSGFAFYSSPNLNNYYCAPNKVYQYLQAGMCVISTNNPPVSNLLNKYRLGICIDNVNKRSIIESVKKIYNENLNINISEEIRREICWESKEKEFIALFK